MSRFFAGLLMLVPALALGQGGQPSITSVVFNPASVAGGRPASAVITISGPAGNNGFDINLSLSSNVAQLSSSAITIGSGQTSTTVQVSTTPTSIAQLATLTATARGESRTGNLTVSPPTVSSISVSPSPVNSGQTATGTITLDGAAPSGGAVVNVSSNNAAATVPATVSVPQGQTSGTFTINTGSVSAQTNATIGASIGTTLRNASLAVLPAALAIADVAFTGVNFSTGTNSGDSKVLITTLNNPAPAGGAIVSYASTGVNFFTSFSRDTADAGSTTAARGLQLPLTGVDLPWTLTATFNGVTTTRTGTLKAPRIFRLTAPDSVQGGDEFTLTASLTALPPSDGVAATVSVDNPAVIAPTSGTAGPSGLRQMTWRVRTNVVAQETPVTITASFLGQSFTTRIRVVPQVALLSFTASPAFALAGQPIILTANLAKAAPAGGAVVQTSASGLPAGMTVPASITVPAGSRSASVTVRTPSSIPSAATVRFQAGLVQIKFADVRINP